MIGVLATVMMGLLSCLVGTTIWLVGHVIESDRLRLHDKISNLTLSVGHWMIQREFILNEFNTYTESL